MGDGFLEVLRARDISVGGVAVFVAHDFQGCSIDDGWAVRSVAGWDAGAGGLVIFVWWLIFTSDPRATQCRSAAADPGRTAVWVMVLAASFFSLFAGVVVMRHAKTCEPERGFL